MGDQDISEIWDAINAMRKEQAVSNVASARVEGKLDGLIARLDERCEVRGTAADRQEVRLTAVEHRVWWASGAVAALAFVWPLLLKLWSGSK